MTCRMDKLLCALFATFGSLLFVVQAQNVVRVRYGYFPEARPVRVACARGWLDYTSGSTFYKVACYPQTSGNFASSRLDSGQLDIADLGSTPLAQALARGLEINVVYITDYKGDSQGIYVRPSEEDTGYAGIENPFDLENRTLGVPFGSTMHYQVLYLLDIFGLSGKVVLRDLSPTEIIQEWDEKLIDAAACWGAAREHVLRENDDTDQPPANTLVTAGVVGDWGRPTFGVVAANRQFMKLHAGFLERFVTVFAQLTDSFIDHLGEDDPNNVARWTPQKAGTSSFIPSLADSIMKPGEPRGNPSDAFINQQRRAMNLYKQQSTSEQLSCDYLMANGGASCGKPSLQHEAIQQTARFLMDQKVIHSMGQLENMGNETNCAFKHTLCGGDLFAGNILKTGNQFYGSSTFLSTLSSSGSVFPLNEIGRLSTGDSSCTAGRKVFYGSGTNSFGDGANAITGKSYSDNLQCSWQVYKDVNCQISQSCTDSIFISFQTVNVWSGDFIRVYSDPTSRCTEDSPKVLLAQITGLQPNLPILRGAGCIFVEFVTDANQEQSYGDSDNTGDGFVARVGKSSSCGSCNGFPCSENGLCECNGIRWGSDCSFTDHCLGTSHIVLSETNEPEKIASSYSVRNGLASSALELYPNDLDCHFEVKVANSEKYVIFEVEYDLETTFDMLELYSGSLGSEPGVTLYTVLTGVSDRGREKYYIPTDSDGIVTIRLVTDSRGRRAGFSGSVWTESRDDPPTSCDIGESGLFCEVPHCIAQNSLGRDMGSSSHLKHSYQIGRVVSNSSEASALPVSSTCSWSLSEVPPPAATAGIRLVFNSPLDLEPHLSSAVGDKLVIQSDAGTVEVFAEKCSSDDQCVYDWQTGICDEARGSCTIKTAFDIGAIDYGTAEAILVTDRNDEDIPYSGIDLDALFVRSCPTEEGREHCELAADGQCVDDVCICEGGIPCSCPCEGGGLVSEVNTGLLVGIVVPLVLIFAGVLFWYRRRKIQRSRAQKVIIAEKEEELEAFRNSIVGMRTASTHYMPQSSSAQESAITNDDKEQSVHPLKPPPPKIQWCWKETSHMIHNHPADMIVGNPADCWVKYDAHQNMTLEDAFQLYTKSRNSPKLGHAYPMVGYKVDFQDMIQTKQQTGFPREVQRLVEIAQPVQQAKSEREVIDYGEVEIGDWLPDDISAEPQMVLVKGDVVQISSQRQDGWAFGTKLHHRDEAVARELVRIATKNSKDDEGNIFADTGWFPLDLTEIPSGEELALLQKKVGDSGSLEPPPYWDAINDPSVVQRHRLGKHDDEREAVIEAFKSTLKPPRFNKKVKIVNVERIQNLGMWQSYVVKRQTICYRESGPDATVDVQEKAIERFERHWLWHGTNAEVMDKIMQQGFNRSFCGKNATVYGKGVYFARDAAYSAWPTYSIPDKNDHQYIMACRVTVGEYCPGVQNAVTPDIRDPSTHTLYDSTVGVLSGDTMSTPSIYVTYHDAQAYPEYLIEFKLT